MITYIDLGLYDGAELDMFLKAVGDRPYKVIGIEAERELYQRLQDKYKDNPNVTILHLAITNRGGFTKLYKAANRQGNSIYSTKNNVGADYEIVPCSTLSDVIYSYGLTEFNILRFNIEGAELEMFEDLIESEYLYDIDLFLGAEPGVDILKVRELKDKHTYYMSLLDTYNIKILPFCEKIKSIDLRDYLPCL